jgi:hypothetical protein
LFSSIGGDSERYAVEHPPGDDDRTHRFSYAHQSI